MEVWQQSITETWNTLLVSQATLSQREEGSGHAATIELSLQEKVGVTNEIRELRRLYPLSRSSNYVTCLADVSILLSNASCSIVVFLGNNSSAAA